MVTRKTRWMSGLVVLLMLVSLFTVFTMPVSAAGQADLKADKGLVDKTSLPNIADGIKSGTTAYQINSRAGFEKMKEIWDAGNQVIQVYQTADIDMGWVPFAGISGNPNNKSWEGEGQLFDGNGFVIKNLLINAPDRSQVALFNRCWANTTIKNVGIASGLIIGWNQVGSIAGINCGGNIINCWSAATIVTGAGGEGAGTGGLVGQFWSRYGNSADMVNSYFIGTIVSKGRFASGLIGRYAEDQTASSPRVFANNYFAGTMASAFGNDDMLAKETHDVTLPGYHVLFRGTADGQRAENASTLKGGSPVAGGTTANNYYRENGSGLKSYADAVAAGVKLNGKATLDVDAATAVTEAQVGDGTLVTKLNSGNLELGAVSGYTLGYVQTADGYPALGYYKDGNLVVCRTAAEGAACTSAEDLAAKGELFNALVAKRNGGIAEGKLQNVTVKTANDLFALGIILFQTGLSSSYVEGDITFAADVDCADCTFVPGCPWMFPIMSTTFDSVLDGKNHVIYNWKGVGVVYSSQPTAGLIRQADGATVKNLGMINAYGEIEYSYSGDIWIYPALMIGTVNDDGTTTTTIENCFVTGHVEVTKDGSYIGAGSSNNAGAIVGRVMNLAAKDADGPLLVMKNCWSDVDRTFTWNKDTAEFRTLGSTKIEYGTEWCPILDNVVYVAKDVLIGSADNTTDDYETQPNVDAKLDDGSMAAYLNNTTIGVYYTVKNGQTVFGTAENATHTLTVNKKMENGTLVSAEEFYYNTGATVTVPTLSGYALKADTLPEGAGETTFAMPAQNWTLDYIAKGIDYESVQDTLDELNKYDASLFVQEEDIEGVAALFEAALAYADEEQTPEVKEAATAAITTAMNAYEALDFSVLTLKDTYPNVPKYSEYDLYKNYNPKNWGISTKEDWIKATEQKSTFVGITIHLLNDVDMKNVNVAPLAYRSYLNGTLDGHGFVFNNLKIESNTTGHVGLVSDIGSTGIVKDLGIASGSISATYVSDNGVGGISGAAEGGAQIIRCWNAATVTGTGNGGISVAGLVGRGYNNSIIDGCYNIGTVNGVNHAAGLNDWGQATANVRNSFNYGTLNAGNVGMVRQNGTADASKHSNSYALGTPYASEGSDDFKTTLNKAPWMQDKEVYTNGVLAWMLNSNRTIGAEVYYTLQDGKTVFGTKENQTIRVTMECTGVPNEYFYINAGETITLDYAENATYAVKSGAGSAVEGAAFTAGTEDAVITVTIVGMNYKALDDAFAYYAERDVTLYADGEEGSLAELIATLKAMKENEQFQAQGMIDAYASVLMAYELKNEYPYFPAAKDAALYGTAAGYLLKDVADLEYVANNPLKFGAEVVLYLDEDITVPADSTANKLHNVVASIDGKGHSLKGITIKGGQNSWLGSYKGAYVKNLVMDSWNGTDLPWQGALLIYAAANVTLENITMKDCTAVSDTENNGLAGLIGIVNNGNRVVTMKNIVVEGFTLDRNNRAGNAGILVGRLQNGTLNIDGVKASGNTITGTGNSGSGLGVLIGEVTGDATLKNIFVDKTIYDGETIARGVLVGFFKLGGETDDQTPSLVLENIVVDDPTNTALVCRGNNSAAEFSATDVYGAGMLMAGAVEMEATATAAQLASGELAYAANAKNYAMKWTMGADGYPVPAAEGDALTHKVQFYAFDETDPDVTEEFALYTDKEGKLIGLTQEILAKAAWAEEETLATKVFAQDGLVTGVITRHTCEFGEPTHVEGTDTHVRYCTDPECDEFVEENCAFTGYAPVQADAKPEEAAHKGVCVCGNETEPVLCSASEDTWYYDETFPEDCTEGYCVEAECDICGYSYYAEGVGARDDHEYGAWTDYAVNSHRRECAHCEAIEQESCTFTGEWEEVTAPQIGVPGQEKRPCDKACGNYEYRDIDALVETAVFGIEMPEKAKPGEEITVSIKLNNNPGVSGVLVDVLYDVDALTLTNVVAGDFEGAIEFLENENGARLGFATGADVTEDGVLFVLTFKVADDADGLFLLDVVAVEGGIVNIENEAINVEQAGGSVAVSNVLVGDVTGDGRVSISDAVMLLRIASGDPEVPTFNMDAANISAEGDTAEMPINTADVILLLQYLTGSVKEL